MNSSETSEFQEYIMGPWAKNQKNKLPSLTAASATPRASCHRKEAECCTPVRSCWSKFFASDWSWYFDIAEKISHTDSFYKNENVLAKGNSFPKKVVGSEVVLDILVKFSGGWFFQILVPKECRQRTPYPLSSRQWPWCRTGRSVHPVGCAGKNKKQYQRMICGFIGWDWWVFLDPRRFILAIHSESPMQRLIQDSASTQPQRASLCLWCRMAEASRYHVMSWYVISCHLTFQSHHNFHHSTAERCFCKVTPSHSLERWQMRSQPCEHLIHQCTKRIPPEASNPALQKMSMIRSKSVHVFCLNFPSHCVILL